MKQYLGGEARQTVDTLADLGGVDVYLKAKTILQKCYGSSFVIAEAYRDKICNWPRIQAKDGITLRRFGDFLQQCLIAKDSVKGLQILDDCHENRKMLERLPEHLVERWCRQICDLDEYPNFETFVAFITREADILCNPITNLKVVNKAEQRKKDIQIGSSFANVSEDTDNCTPIKCLYCQKRYHGIVDCRTFINKSSQERSEFILKHGLCFGCLKKGHVSKICPQRSCCRKCSKNHPTSLHDDYVERDTKEQMRSSTDIHGGSSTASSDGR